MKYSLTFSGHLYFIAACHSNLCLDLSTLLLRYSGILLSQTFKKGNWFEGSEVWDTVLGQNYNYETNTKKMTFSSSY